MILFKGRRKKAEPQDNYFETVQNNVSIKSSKNTNSGSYSGNQAGRDQFLSLHYHYDRPADQPTFQLTCLGSVKNNPSFISPPYFSELIHQLSSSDNVNIQLAGMGGMGKSTVLQQLYYLFVAKGERIYNHVAYFEYSNSCEQMLNTPLNGKPESEDPVTFLIRQAEIGRLLILIDDISKNTQTIDLSRLESIKATVVLASRRPCKNFTLIDVTDVHNILALNECRELYLKARYLNQQRPELDISTIDTLNKILTEKAALHYLVIQRLGSIAKDGNLSPIELETLLSQKGFCLKHEELGSEQHLDEEIKKLYDMQDLSEIQKQLLSSISAFPALPLPLNMWAEWLKESIDIEENECRRQLNTLKNSTWLTSDGDNIKMHLIVAQAINAQFPPAYPFQISLFITVYDKADQLILSDRNDWHILAIGLFLKALELLEIHNKQSKKLQEQLVYKMQNYWDYFPVHSLNFLNKFIQTDTVKNRVLANVLQSMGILESRLGKIEAAQAHYAKAEKLYRAEQAMLGLANVLLRIGILESKLGKIEAAQAHYTEAEKLYRAEQAMHGLANVLLSMGNLESRLGKIDAAQAHYTDAEKLYREKQDMLGLANTLLRMGVLESQLGKIEAAQAHYTEAEKLYRDEQDMLGLADVSKSMGDLECKLGEIEAAQTHYTKAEKLYRDEQVVLELADVLKSMGILERSRNKYENAVQKYETALGLYKDQQNSEGIAYTMGELCRIYPYTHDKSIAMQFINNTVELFDGFPEYTKEYVSNCINEAKRLLNSN